MLTPWVSARPAKLFCTTVVTFRNEWNVPEEGRDSGGLTAEMFTDFWQSALQPEAGFFVGHGRGQLLPSPTAPLGQLEAVGVALCKCVLDDHPIGFGIAVCAHQSTSA